VHPVHATVEELLQEKESAPPVALSTNVYSGAPASFPPRPSGWRLATARAKSPQELIDVLRAFGAGIPVCSDNEAPGVLQARRKLFRVHDGSRAGVNDEGLQLIRELDEAGWAPGAIAVLLGIHPQAIGQVMDRAGLD